MIQKCDPCQQPSERAFAATRITRETVARGSRKPFQWNKKDYLIVAYYYSRYFEMCQLYSTSSSTVMNKAKSSFVGHGIPGTAMSDNGPQFVAEDYKVFAANYEFFSMTQIPTKQWVY